MTEWKAAAPRGRISRREFLAQLTCGLGTMSLTRVQGAESGPRRDSSRRPNVILFLIDDQNKASIGACGGKTWTPNLDRMAREGVRFTQAHVSSTVCTPSRYSFLTGRYAGNSYSELYSNACGGEQQQGYPSFNMALESDRMNVGRVLREAGYVTGFVGKYHLVSELDHPLISGEGQLDALPKVMTPRGELLKTVEQNGFDPNSPTAGEAWIDDALGAILNKLKALGIDQDTLVVFAPDHGRDGKASLFSQDGTCIPCIARWPKRIRPGLVCEELVQNIDWAPTFFEIAGARVPAGYPMDGRSLTRLFEDGTASEWRDHLYFEMGAARAVATRDWKYIAVRYTKEQIEAIQRARPESLPRLMSYIGRLGIGVRGAERPGFFDADQLYNLRVDPTEMNNLAARAEHADRLDKMRQMLRADLERMHRPFGEFVPGGNAAPPGQIDEQIAMVKKVKIDGKNVSVVEGQADEEPAAGARRKTRPPRTKRRSL